MLSKECGQYNQFFILFNITRVIFHVVLFLTHVTLIIISDFFLCAENDACYHSIVLLERSQIVTFLVVVKKVTENLRKFERKLNKI